jgi:hypothetical protein
LLGNAKFAHVSIRKSARRGLMRHIPTEINFDLDELAAMQDDDFGVAEPMAVHARADMRHDRFVAVRQEANRFADLCEHGSARTSIVTLAPVMMIRQP